MSSVNKMKGALPRIDRRSMVDGSSREHLQLVPVAGDEIRRRF